MKSIAAKHYEDNFEFPLWKLIRQRAEEKDISYLKASLEVLPEYEKGIRYRDKAFEESMVAKRRAEVRALAEREQGSEKG